MFTNRSGHAWHMVLMIGIVVAAFWLGAGAGSALLLASLACTAMMVALVWIAVRATAAAPHDGQRPVSASSSIIAAVSESPPLRHPRRSR